MTMVLHRSADRQGALESFLDELQDPRSPQYHHWLSPDEFGERFGVSAQEIGHAEGWLRAQGFQVESVSRSRGWISFRGTVSQAEEAFHTEIHRYVVNGVEHIAPTVLPLVPAELSKFVSGIRGLDDFYPQPRPRLKPMFTGTDGTHAMGPGDFWAIYGIVGALSVGAGLTIAVVGESAIDLTDIRKFNTTFSTGQNDPVTLLAGDDPGIAGGAAFQEAEADVEWAGGIAPAAKIVYTYATDVVVATQTAIDQNLAPILTFSFGICEQNVTPIDAAFFRDLAQQANAQGITWVASSGDAGAAGCDQGSILASNGLSVMVPASLPEVTALGGTEFNEGQGGYWGGNGNGLVSAGNSYIPEMAWNDTATTPPLSASGGGASILFAKPSWQTGPGVPADGARDVPDISLSASFTHDPYIAIIGGQAFGVGGTSLAAPAFAGMLALAEQGLGSNSNAPLGVGNINPLLYANLTYPVAPFNDITTGGNMVPCIVGTKDCNNGSLGYTAGPGYDQVTGLGSISFRPLMSGIQIGDFVTLAVSATQVGVGTPVSLTATVRGYNGRSPAFGDVDFTDVSGGNTVRLGRLNVDGNGVATLPYQFSVGTHLLTATFEGTVAFRSSSSTSVTVVVVPAGPVMPVLISPANNASNVPVGTSLKWANPGAPTSIPGFDLYFGTAPSPAYWGRCLDMNGTCWPGALAAATTYYWKLVATNNLGSVSTPVWSFTTSAANYTVSTVAGQVATSGYSLDGTKATNALLGTPTDIFLDRSGNLYIADRAMASQTNPPSIRMINGSGTLSTVAGGPVTNGAPTASVKLVAPVAVVADEQGNVYISDDLSAFTPEPTPSSIWKVSNGAGTLLSGADEKTGTPIGPWTENPISLALDSNGFLYIDDLYASCISEIAAGVASTFAGQCGAPAGSAGDGGPATSASLAYPYGVAFDSSGKAYISDSTNCKIRSVVNGIIETLIDFNSVDPGCSAGGSLRIVVDSQGSLYFYRGSNIYKWTAGVLTMIAGGGETTAGEGGPGTGLALQTYTGSLAIGPSGQVYFIEGSAIRVLTPGYIPPAPAIAVNGFRNGATLLPGPVTPGSIATLSGNFGVASPAQTAGTSSPTTLGGLTIQMQSGAGINAPLLYTSEGQVNIQIPWELQGQTSVGIRALLNGVAGSAQTAAIAPFSPGIFVNNNQPAITDTSGALLGSSNPVTAGSVVQIYCTGLGPVSNPPASGNAAGNSSATLTSPMVTIGGFGAAVLSSGLAPGTVGEYLVKVQVPAGIAPGPAVPLFLSIGGAVSNTVNIALR